jgi:hypothetical protein
MLAGLGEMGPAMELADGSLFEVETVVAPDVATSLETGGVVICVIFDGEPVLDPSVSTSFEMEGVII